MNYFIHIASGRYPLSEMDIRSENPNTSFPIPFQPTDDYAVVQTTECPSFNNATHAVKELAPVLVDGKYCQVWEVVELDPTVVAANQAAKAASDAAALEAKYSALWAAADKYVAGYISGVAIGLLTVGVLQSKPKALAITQWSSSVWAEYYVRKANVTLTSVDNLDFTGFGAMPYSVPELQAEVGL